MLNLLTIEQSSQVNQKAQVKQRADEETLTTLSVCAVLQEVYWVAGTYIISYHKWICRVLTTIT